MRVHNILKTAVRPFFHEVIRIAGRSHIAGNTLDQAMGTVEHLRGRGYSFTLGYWNAQGESATAVADANNLALDAIQRTGGGGYCSIKAPPLGFDYELYTSIVDKGGELGVPVHLDSHSHQQSSQTLELITKSAITPQGNIGITLPGRWERSLEDADTAAELGLNVRVVKGQWPDPDDPDRDPRAGFFSVVDRLAGRVPKVRVASHDAELVTKSVERLRHAGTDCEIELLYGLPVKDVLPVATDRRIPVRIYVPYGAGSLPYSLEYLRRNPRVLWWLLKDACSRPFRPQFPWVRLGGDG